MTSTTPSADWRESVTSHYTKLGKLTQFARLIGLQNLQSHQKEQALNREAESKAVRRQWLGNEADSMQADDMGHNILGDINHPAPVIVAGGDSSSGLKTLAALALGGLLGSGGLAAGAAAMYFAARQQEPAKTVEQPAEQTDYSLGLGKLEDYLAE